MGIILAKVHKSELKDIMKTLVTNLDTRGQTRLVGNSFQLSAKIQV